MAAVTRDQRRQVGLNLPPTIIAQDQIGDDMQADDEGQQARWPPRRSRPGRPAVIIARISRQASRAS